MESVKLTRYFYPDGDGPKGIEYEDWYLDSPAEYIRHRTDGPARIIYYTCGKIWSKHWYLYGKEHRDSEPAIIYYYKSGKVKSEEWYLNGKYHRACGPAGITYSESGIIQSEVWYLNDEEIEPHEWLKENRYRWPLNKEKQTELLLTFG